MSSWFVSTTRPLGREVEWVLTPLPTEDAARAFASNALVRGLRVEAGTVPGVEPKVKIGWQAAHHWAQLANDDGIMGLRRRLNAFAG